MESFAPILFDTLKELKIIDPKRLEQVFANCQSGGSSFQEKLLLEDLITDEDLGKTVAEILKVPFVKLSALQIPRELTLLIPETYARTHQVIAFQEQENQVGVAMVEPSQFSVIAPYLEQKAGKSVKLYYATQRDFEKNLKIYKQNLQVSYDDLLKEQLQSVSQHGISEAPIERIVSTLIEYAYANAASDIHIGPEKEQSQVRFRIDGVMQEVLDFSLEVHQQVISRIKFLSKLRTDEHLSAQDGKFQTRVESEDLDLRVSIVPIVHGEKCVLRLLSSRYRQFGLSDLGMSQTDLEKVKKAIGEPFGMILSTGPTGCGKTTTIYSLLKILNTSDRNIATIEDPVEYEIEGLSQIQVNPKTNITFAEGLKSILRQDPNIIYVGEIRDDETASIAVNSALTGHLVVSTLHTNDAVTALPRLLDMKIEPFLVASTVSIVIAQRLVRKICEKCKVSIKVKTTELEQHFTKEQVKASFKKDNEHTIFMGKGCPVCRGSGYQGRVGIFEVLVLSEKIQDLIIAKADSLKIMQEAVAEGMTTMIGDGLAKIQNGITTIEEVLRATKE